MPAKSARSSYKRPKRAVKSKKSVRYNYKTIRSVTLILVLSFISLCVMGFGLANNAINQKFALADSNSSYDLDDNASPSLLYVSVDNISEDRALIKKASLLIADKENKKLISFDIPVTLEFDVPGKYGFEKFEKVFELGNLNAEGEKNLVGITLLKQSIFKMFAYKVDGFIVTDISYESALNDYIYKGSISALISSGVLSTLNSKVYTDLRPKVVWDYASFVSSLPSERVYRYEFSNDGVFSDDLFRELSYESALTSSSKSIAVLNGTAATGVATFGSRVLRNIGGRIVAVDNSTKQYQESVILTGERTPEVYQIARTFGIEKVILKSESTFEDADLLLQRADIVVILGFDILDRL